MAEVAQEDMPGIATNGQQQAQQSRADAGSYQEKEVPDPEQPLLVIVTAGLKEKTIAKFF